MEILSSNSKYKGWGMGVGRRCISSYKQSQNPYRGITFFFSLNPYMGEGGFAKGGGG